MVKQILIPFHEQFKEEITIERENILAKEIRQTYCQLSVIRRNQAVILAQSNGLLAATTLNMPTCSRLQGLGLVLILQQCETKRINITAKETTCGFQPYFNHNNVNFTIGLDGWSMHPFVDCFWPSQYVNFNDKIFKWIFNQTHGEWQEQTPTIHSYNLNLISEFKELPLKDYDYMVQAHPAHDIIELEHDNVVNELISRVQEAQSNSLNKILMTTKQDSNINYVSTWTENLKFMSLGLIGFILLIIGIKCFSILDPLNRFRRKSRNANIPMITLQTSESTNQLRIRELNEPSAPNDIPVSEQNTSHSHNHCTYIVGKGLVWEDLCPCTPDNK